MNILFVSDNQPVPTYGGIERVICNLQNAFSDIGMACHTAYFKEIDGTFCGGFSEQKELSANNFIEELSSIIRDKQIQIVLNCVIAKNNIRRILPQSRVLMSTNPTTQFVYCFHNYPGFEQRSLPIGYIIMRMLHSRKCQRDDISSLGRSLTNKLCPWLTRGFLRKKYKIITEHAENIVLLSESYKMDLANIVGIKEVPTGWISIGNALTFPTSINVNEGDKEKLVLIVSRLEEEQKRLSIALKIWEELCTKYDLPDWKLVIVGDGIDRPIYERMVTKRNIPNVTFEGRQKSLPYYLKASLFLMTSAYEGFPMVILESMQCGCVPIAFDTFSAIKDLIDDGENGFVIESGNKEKYVENLHLLMQDETLRKKLAINGMKSVQRFSVENVMRQWYDLFKRLQTS